MGDYYEILNLTKGEKVDPLKIDSTIGGKRSEFFSGHMGDIVFDLLSGRWAGDSVKIVNDEGNEQFKDFKDISSLMESSVCNGGCMECCGRGD